MEDLIGMAVLTKERNLTDKKLPMVTAVGLMADQTILLHRRMLPHERPSLFGVALKAELVDRIGPQHLVRSGPNPCAKTIDRGTAKTAHGIVATGACERLSSNKRLLYWMMGLFICLSPDIPMTVEAEVRLGDH